MPPMKKDQEDMFKLYLEEKFNGLHYRLNDIVKNQDDADISIKELFHIVDTMREVDANKCLVCSNTGKVNLIRKDLDGILFIIKYWKPFLITALVVGVGFVIGADNAWSTFKDKYTKDIIKYEQQVEKVNQKVTTNTGVINANAEIQKNQIKREDERTNTNH